VLTADPRLVPAASYDSRNFLLEAAELAYFGAKVLHPKDSAPGNPIWHPVWIRNTFAPDGAEPKITPTGPPHGGGVKAPYCHQ